jgi:putative membrane protein
MAEPAEPLPSVEPTPAAPPAAPGHRLTRLLTSLRARFEPPTPAEAVHHEKTANELAAERTTLAIDRTLMAADRSLMAWIRTALSMISFGFTIYKLLQGFAAAGTELAKASSPRAMGLFLTGLGTLAMVFGTVEYWVRLKELRRARDVSFLRPSLVMSVLMSMIGLFMFIAITFRVL